MRLHGTRRRRCPKCDRVGWWIGDSPLHKQEFDVLDIFDRSPDKAAMLSVMVAERDRQCDAIIDMVSKELPGMSVDELRKEMRKLGSEYRTKKEVAP